MCGPAFAINLTSSKRDSSLVLCAFADAMDADGTPVNSEALAACQKLLEEYLPKLKALPNATVSRVVCGGCGDFKVIINQPAADHGVWKDAEFAPQSEFIAKLGAIEGVTRVETQEYTLETL